jgi:hypothetical protein
VFVEIRLSARMRVVEIQVEADMLLAEILQLVRDHLINTCSVGSTPLIFAALQYVFDERNDFTSSVKACEGLSILRFRESAAARALWHARWKTTSVFRNTVAASVRARNMFTSALSHKSPTLPVGVVGIAVALALERSSGAVLERADVLHLRVRRGMPASADIHAHPAAFTCTLAALGDMGRAPSRCMDHGRGEDLHPHAPGSVEGLRVWASGERG